MPSGWARWILEQFEFPFEVVYPAGARCGQPRAKYDVLIFPRRRHSAAKTGRPTAAAAAATAAARGYPGRVQGSVGQRHRRRRPCRSSCKFVEAGGYISPSAARRLRLSLGLPVADALVEKAPEGRNARCRGDKFYVRDRCCGSAWTTRTRWPTARPGQRGRFLRKQPGRSGVDPMPSAEGRAAGGLVHDGQAAAQRLGLGTDTICRDRQPSLRPPGQRGSVPLRSRKSRSAASRTARSVSCSTGTLLRRGVSG